MATKKKKIEAPTGFKEVSNTLVGFWRPEQQGETIQGIVHGRIETIGAEGKPSAFYTLRITDPTVAQAVTTSKGDPVECERGDLVGVGGAILVSFCQGREGQEVFLIFQGMGERKKGKNPAKLYSTYAREIDPETGEVLV